MSKPAACVPGAARCPPRSRSLPANGEMESSGVQHLGVRCRSITGNNLGATSHELTLKDWSQMVTFRWSRAQRGTRPPAPSASAAAQTGPCAGRRPRCSVSTPATEVGSRYRSHSAPVGHPAVPGASSSTLNGGCETHSHCIMRTIKKESIHARNRLLADQ